LFSYLLIDLELKYWKDSCQCLSYSSSTKWSSSWWTDSRWSSYDDAA